MTDRELMQQALEALELIDEAMPFPVAKMTIKNLRERLAQPTLQEAVVMRERSCAECGKSGGWALYCVACMEKLSRREWVGLTAEEVGAEAREFYGSSHWDDFKFARAIEAKLKEKNQ